MPIVVQKFGGSSVATTERLQDAAKKAARARQAGDQVVVTVSALGDTTDELIELAKALNPRPSRREMDMLLSTGEQVSIALLAMAIDALGQPVVSLTGPQAGILTDDVYNKARILEVKPKRIQAELAAGRIVIVAGFQGVNGVRDITTLGRGGSDTTAVALAAALGADVCEIYTDVEGVYTADPRIEPNARKLLSISYGEMLEMASLGATVLQPRAVELAAQHGVRIHVRSSLRDVPGTFVQEVSEMEGDRVVSGVTHDTNVAKVVIAGVPDHPGVAHTIFSALAAEGINVDMIVQSTKSEHTTDLLFSMTRDDLPVAREVVDGVAKQLGAERFLADERVAKVSIVGAGMMSNPGVASRMFGTLADRDINIHVISTSEIKVSCLIDEDRVADAVRALHARFDLAAPRSDVKAG